MSDFECYFNVPYPESCFHVQGVEGLNIDELWTNSAELCEDDAATIIIMEIESDKCHRLFKTYLKYASTQGVHVALYPNDKSHLDIHLAWANSEGDIKLAFAYLKVLQQLCPGCKISFNKEIEPFELNQTNFQRIVSSQLDNIAALMEEGEDGEDGVYSVAQGIYREFTIPPRSFFPDSAEENLAAKVLKMFFDLQWEYEDFVEPEEGEFHNEKTNISQHASVIANTQNYLMRKCDHFLVIGNHGSLKDVTAKEFLEKLADNPYFKTVGLWQYALRKMPRDEWQTVYESLEGEEYPVSDVLPPQTFLLRWNPQISSFTPEMYREATTQCPEGFLLDWSVYEWEQAHMGDNYYMVRVGDEKGGIVWNGMFLSEPYEGDDWAGKGKMRHYVDIDCNYVVAPEAMPHLTTEELQKALPHIEWTKGPSGELLSFDDAEVLEKLFSQKAYSNIYYFYVVGHSIYKIEKMLEDLGFTKDTNYSRPGTNTAIVNLVNRTYYTCHAGVAYGGYPLAHGVTMSEMRHLIELYDNGGAENIKSYIEELREKYKGFKENNDMGCSYWELE